MRLVQTLLNGPDSQLLDLYPKGMRIPARARRKGYSRKYLCLGTTGIFNRNEYKIGDSLFYRIFE